jgi:membrane protease YdiL (CAAX protease family)
VPLAFFAVIYYLIFIIVLNAEVQINNSYSFPDFLNGSWWTLKSVLYEELLFRGALLFLAIKYFGKLRGIFLSSIVFGIYHWFSYNVFGDIPQMLSIFIITGVGGLVFAWAFVKTQSLYLPIGLHFGWNLVSVVVFSQGPLGEQLLISSTHNTLEGWWILISFLYQILILPAATFFILKYLNGRIPLRIKAVQVLSGTQQKFR